MNLRASLNKWSQVGKMKNGKCKGSHQKFKTTLASMDQRFECRLPTHLKVAGSIPDQGTWVAGGRQPNEVALYHHCFSVSPTPIPSTFSKNNGKNNPGLGLSIKIFQNIIPMAQSMFYTISIMKMGSRAKRLGFDQKESQVRPLGSDTLSIIIQH